jgi:hypothetical protein
VVPQWLTEEQGLEESETVTLCTDCHRCITNGYNDLADRTADQQRQFFEEMYVNTDMTPRFDWMLWGALLVNQMYRCHPMFKRIDYDPPENEEIAERINHFYQKIIIEEEQWWINIWDDISEPQGAHPWGGPL